MTTNETTNEITLAPGLVADESRTWDFRPFGQSREVRKHRITRGYLSLNAWKVSCGLLSRKTAKKAALRYAERVVAENELAGAKCAVRMGSRTWLATL